jgi:protocatechuate 3,4-dioxygenase beta subunit
MSFSPNRRHFLAGGLAVGASAFCAPGAFAEELARTPRQTEGPFYPDRLPLDTDNDLLILNDSLTPAVGQVTHLTGRVLDARGKPVKNAAVEIWQVDNNAVYIHTQCPNREKRDRNFQGFGRFVTGSTGEYYFRTIKPVPYPGRAPHIHVAILQNGRRMLTTQLYIKSHPQNQRDGIFRRLGDAQSLVSVDFKPIPDSKLGELAAHFDVVIGQTPEDRD